MAHRLNLITSALLVAALFPLYALIAQEAADAVAAGASGLEHISMLPVMPPSLIAAIVAHHVTVDPTFGEFRTALTLDHDSPNQIAAAMQRAYAMVRVLDAAGVALAIGTDSPMVAFGQGYLNELGEFAAAGFAPDRVLTFATLNNAAYLGQATNLGQIAPGFDADLLLVRANPLAGVQAMDHPVWVMQAGQRVY